MNVLNRSGAVFCSYLALYIFIFFGNCYVKDFLKDYMATYNLDVDEDTWFSNLKSLAEKYKFTGDRKAYKADPSSFNGQVGDAAGFIRLCLALRKNTPNIYYVQKILGKEKVFERINKIIAKF